MTSMKNNTQDINQPPHPPQQSEGKSSFIQFPNVSFRSVLRRGVWQLNRQRPRSEMLFTRSFQDCTRDRQISFIVLRSLERFASICNCQFITIFLCGLGGKERDRGCMCVYGVWVWVGVIGLGLLTKQFQQVETCFWICNSPTGVLPHPLHFVAHLWCSCCSCSRCASFPFQQD